MRLDRIKTDPQKTLRCDPPDASSGLLADPVNVVFDRDRLKTRPGISAITDRLLFDEPLYSGGSVKIEVTDACLEVWGERGRVVVVILSDENTFVLFLMKLVFADGRVADLGRLEFTRSSETMFSVPGAYVIYHGSPVRGAGLFFLTYRTAGVREEDLPLLYELSSDRTEWIRLYDEDFYLPVVYAHGRGDSYLNARSEEQMLVNLPSPVKLQDRNLLTGGFISYFTSDGLSFSFMLPYTGLSNESIRCRFEASRDYFHEWVIPAGEQESQPDELMGEQVVMYCNRSTGRIYFRNTEGAAFRMIYNGIVNNLCFTAYKTEHDNLLKATSMKVAKRFSGSAAGAATEKLVLAGSRYYPSTLIWIDPQNPLYFPESCAVSVGDGSQCVTALSTQGRTLLAFKDSELYAGTFVSAAGYDLERIVLGKTGVSGVAEDSIRFSRVGRLSAAPVPDTVREVEGQTVFATVDRRVFAAVGNSAESVKLCDLSPTLDGDPLRAAAVGKRYWLFTQRGCTALDCESVGKSPAWYAFSFPDRMVTGIPFDGQSVLIADHSGDYYCLLPYDGPDTVLDTDQEELSSVTREIAGRFRVTDGRHRDRVHRLYGFCAEIITDEPFTVTLFDGRRPLVTRRFDRSGGSVSIRCGGYFRDFKAEFRCDGRMEYKGFSLLCRATEKI